MSPTVHRRCQIMAVGRLLSMQCQSVIGQTVVCLMLSPGHVKISNDSLCTCVLDPRVSIQLNRFDSSFPFTSFTKDNCLNARSHPWISIVISTNLEQCKLPVLFLRLGCSYIGAYS